MKERPILFKGPMVKAILADLKTQTRRVVDPQPTTDERGYISDSYWLGKELGGLLLPKPKDIGRFHSQYGLPGDRLWVRETWADVNSPGGPAICYRADSDIRTWEEFSKTFGPDYGAGPSMDYKAYPGDYTMWYEDLLRRDEHKEPGYAWKPSIFMPRWASRINLEITEIRVERLQDISEKDAIAEGIIEDGQCIIGVDCYGGHPIERTATRYFTPGGEEPYECAADAFRVLWDSINGQPSPVLKDKKIVSYVSYPWEDVQETRTHRGKPWLVCGNPFVWAISFRREVQP